MNAEAILARLKSVRRNGSGWMSRCPAHLDKSPSLSVRNGSGRVLMHCFAGCTIEAICEALNIRLNDLFNEPCAVRKREPRVLREAQEAIARLRSRLTPRDRERAVTIIMADEASLNLAFARALALAVEGELVQVTFEADAQ